MEEQVIQESVQSERKIKIGCNLKNEINYK